MSVAARDRTCELDGCETTYPRTRGRWAPLCPEHRNAGGYERLCAQRDQAAYPADRPLRVALREAAGVETSLSDSDARRERITSLLGVEAATRRVLRAEDELRAARKALRAASTLAARFAPSASRRND